MIPPHLKYAIEHEKKCIELRKLQIRSYKFKIDLLEKGKDYEEVNKLVSPVKSDISFNKKKYYFLKGEK